MATSTLQRLRRQAFIKQHGCCFYCGHPVWEDDQQTFAKIHGIAARLCRHLRCTAEHLLARKDNGRELCDNIVAACLWCNRERHRGRQHHAPEPAIYKTWVRAQVSKAKWHPVVTSRASRPNFEALIRP